MKKKIILLIALILFPAVGFAKTYTRKELQDYVVSTALSYYWNKNYTDYEGYWRDEAYSVYTDDYKKSPEMISRSNRMLTQCDAFVTSVYKFSVGYTFSEFRGDILTGGYRYNTFKDKNGNLIEAGSSDKNLKIANEEFYKVVSVDLSNKIARNHYAGSKSPSPIVILTYQKGKLSTIDGTKNTSKDITSMTENEQNIIIEAFKKALQPGDIILNDGHAMLWVGDALEKNGGILHSSGLSYKNGDESNITTGYDDFSVRYSNIDYLIEKQVKHHGSKINTVITILRPINALCGGNDSNTCNATINSNAPARSNFKNLKVEQFIYNEVDDTVMSTTTSSIGKGKNLSYRLYLKNMSNSNYCTSNTYNKKDTCTSNGYEWKTTENKGNYSGLTITATIPNNTKFVKCSKNCIVSGNTITWNNVSINAGDAEGKYYYVVQTTASGVTIVNNGFKLYNGNNTLTMSEIKTKVNSTISGSFKTQFKNIINEELKLDTINYKTQKDFIASIYTKFYASNTKVNDNTFTDLLDANKIGKAVFEKHKFDEYYEVTTPGKTATINKMVVEHFYGGRKYEQTYHEGEMTYYGDRIKPIWSSAMQFNYGDIIVILNENNGEFSFKNMFIYTGYNNNIPTYTYLENGEIIQHRLISNYHNTNTNWYSNKFLLYQLHNADLYVVLRPSQIYTPVLIETTPTPNEENKTTPGITLNLEDTAWTKETCTSPYIFNEKDKSCTIPITIEENNEETEVKEEKNTNTLPTPKKEGYDFKGWYYKEEGVDEVEEEIAVTTVDEIPNADIQIYPKWEKIDNINTVSNIEVNKYIVASIIILIIITLGFVVTKILTRKNNKI